MPGQNRFPNSFWNAGGLTIDKFSDRRQVLVVNDMGIFEIIEAGVASDNMKYFNATGYQAYALPRSKTGSLWNSCNSQNIYCCKI